MNLTSPSQVKAWCIEHDFHPNRTMGQNFLIDRNALEAIVDAGLDGVPAGAPVLEIGPGLGVLTEEMLRRGHPVVAIEKDPVLAARLAAEGRDGLTVVTGDALDPRVRAAADGCVAMVSNLPYQAGTRILLELVQRRAFKRLTVLVQTEVAERLAAKEGSKVRGLAGVWMQLDYDVALVRPVKASCFWPRPEIGSMVVRLTRHHRNDALPAAVRDMLRGLAKQAFEHRRKQLGTIFKGVVESAARAEELSNEDWLGLAEALANEKKVEQ